MAKDESELQYELELQYGVEVRNVKGESETPDESTAFALIEEERALLARVTLLLRETPEPKNASEAPIIQELQRVREALVSGEAGTDEVALRDQWNRQNALLQQIRRAGDAPRVDPRSPYFAHIRLCEDGKERDLCLGRATFIESGVRVVDWRNAPVSRIFYRYEQGEEYEENFAGRARAGVVMARRTVAIRDAQLERVEAPEGIFVIDAAALGGWRRTHKSKPRLAGGEAAALRAHAAGEGDERRLGVDHLGMPQRVDKHLPEITSLIDPAQFDLITRGSSGFLAIRGTAGSGKTTVALHRIAYLAYDDPRIDSEQTLFVVFSPGLRNYVGHVLPSLGVSNVKLATFHEWVSHHRRRHFPKLPNDIRQSTPANVQRFKLHPALGVALAKQVETTEGSATGAQAVDDWTSVLTNEALLQEVFLREAPDAFRPDEITRVVDWNRRCNEELFAWAAGDEDSPAELDEEDDALLLRAWQLRVGPLRDSRRKPLRYRHIAVDEVQDFSPLEVRVLLDCLDDDRSITLAGDTQQHLVTDSGFTSWPDFLAKLGVPGAEVETLQVAYRSSAEIVEFSLSLLGDLREDDERPITTRTGPPVELFRFTDRGACVVFLADALKDLGRAEPLASVAVLTPDATLTELYFRGLVQSEVPEVRCVSNQNFTFTPGIEVTEIEQVKGLEFDYVVLVDVTSDYFPDEPAARRRLHVGATRAVHQLWLTSVGTPSSLVAGLAGLTPDGSRSVRYQP